MWLKSQNEPLGVCMHTLQYQTLSGIEVFACTISFLQFVLNKNVPLWTEWTRKHRNLTWANRSKTCLWEGRLATPAKAAIGWAKALPWSPKTSWEKSSRAEETSQEAQKRLKSQRQRGASRRHSQKAEQTARRLLDQSEGNARRHKTDSNNNNDDATSDKSTYTTSKFVYRNDVSNDEQGLNAVRPLFTNSHQRI